MDTNASMTQKTISRLHAEGNSPLLNLACNSDACYVATSEYELVYFSRMAAGEDADAIDITGVNCPPLSPLPEQALDGRSDYFSILSTN